MTILKDVPSSFGAYAPENFDHRFLGPVTATDALNFSRNIPAVYVASRLRQPTLYQFLRLSGVTNMASENHYGLSLVLGAVKLPYRSWRGSMPCWRIAAHCTPYKWYKQIKRCPPFVC